VILAGDVGGTKTVLALCDDSSGSMRTVRQQRFVATEIDSLDHALDQFLRAREADALIGACFGVAGPVADGIAKITNLPWVIDANQLSRKLGGIDVTLINDLQATALGSLVVPADKFAVLQKGVPMPRHSSRVMAAVAPPSDSGPMPPPRTRSSTRPHVVPPEPSIAVMALGTGLGEAMLVWDGKKYRALPSEGGHADFAPTTDDEIELLKFLRAKHGGHVSYERVLSGDGIGEIYTFLRGRSNEREPMWLAHAMASGDTNAAIANAALAATTGGQSDAVCVHTMQMFAEILGAEAGNIALRTVAAGGVVIGGGIPHKILPILDGTVTKRFTDKGRFANWTRSIDVRVLLEPRAAVLGAAHYVATSK
jgi:glucokinase